MKKILLIPSSDYVNHPFPQRHNHIFERLNSNKSFEIHVVRFSLFEGNKLETGVKVHELRDLKFKSVSLYYLTNMLFHSGLIFKIVKSEGIDAVVVKGKVRDETPDNGESCLGGVCYAHDTKTQAESNGHQSINASQKYTVDHRLS